MKLSDKLARLEDGEARPDAGPIRGARQRRRALRGGAPVPMRRRVRARVLEEVGSDTADASSPAQFRRRVARAVASALDDEGSDRVEQADRRALVDELTAEILGYGPVDALLADPAVNEVMCNDFDEVWVEREGRMERTDVSFADPDHYRSIIDRIVAGVGRRLDEASPMVDARLPDGSRVNAVIPPLTRSAPALTIRKFRTEPYTVKDLVNLGTMSLELALFLEACVRGRRNVLISGGTGTGKTTTLNVLSGFVPETERIVTIEDVFELRLHQPHVVALEYRAPNAEARGEVTIRDLVRNSLRMRPDRIVVGECRGAEALDMLQAMNTGHEGSLTTVHANSTRDSLARVETMVLMAGFDLPVRAIREQVAAALDVIVQLERLRGGDRRVVEVAEVHGMEGDTIILQKLFAFDYLHDRLEATGLRPHLLEELEARGIEAPPPWGVTQPEGWR